MPYSMASKIGLHFVRFAQYSATTAGAASAPGGLRGAFSNATSSSASSSTASSSSSWAQGLSSGGAGPGLGGAKFHAGRGAHSSFQHSGRALANANASTANDGSNTFNDDEEERGALAAAAGSHHLPLRQSAWRSSIRATATGAAARFRITERGLNLAQRNSNLLLLSAATFDGAAQSSRAITTSSANAAPAPTTPTSASNRSPLLASSSGQVDSAVEDDVLELSISAAARPTPSRRRRLTTSSINEGDAQWGQAPSIEELESSMPASEISRRGNRSNNTEDRKRSVSRGRTRSSQATKSAPMYEELMNLQGGRFGELRYTVKQFRKLPKSQLTTPSFNAALERLMEMRNRAVQISDRKAITEDVVDTYVQMIDSDCAPDARTYSSVVEALCHREESGISDSFDQALALADLAHASNNASGFPSLAPYNALMRICMLQGKGAVASKVAAMLASNPEVRANQVTMQHLIIAHARDESKTKQERLDICKALFEQLTSVQDEVVNSLWVWNSTIKAHFMLGDAAGAFGLVERMLAAAGAKEGERQGPSPNVATSSIVLGGLLDNHDLTGAVSWYNRLCPPSSSSEAEKPTDSLAEVMPPPKIATLLHLVIELVETLEEANLKALPTNELMSFLPALESANRLMQTAYERVKSEEGKDGESGEVGEESGKDSTAQEAMQSMVPFGLMNGLIDLNISVAERIDMRKESSLVTPAASSSLSSSSADLIDLSLSHLRTQYELMGEYAHIEKSAEVAEDAIDPRSFWPAIQNTMPITRLVNHLASIGRVQDAAAAFTYALYAMPRVPDNAKVMIHAAGVENGWKRMLHAINSNVKSVFCGNRTQDFNEAVEELNLSAEPAEHLVAGAEVMYDAVQPLAAHLQEWSCMRLVQLFLAARERGEISLTPKGWGNVVAAFARAEALRPIADLEGARNRMGPLFDCIGRLGEEEARLAVSLQGAFDVLVKKYGVDEAHDLVARANPDAAASMRQSITPPRRSSSESSGSGSVAHTTSAGPSTPMTAESTLQETSSTAASEDGNSSGLLPPTDHLPPVQNIDQDLDEHIRRIMSEGFPKGQRINQERVTMAAMDAYNILQHSITETGTYPAMLAIVRLLDAFGRAGQLEKINEVHLIGSHLVRAMGTALDSDPMWQQRAWYDLENAMIAALAHGGDTKAASAHRHKVIQAGMVPSADSYAALIATVRDTTDDALVAEELFDESQRLGVQGNTYLYNTVISQLSRARKAERALQLFDEVLAAQARGDRRCKVTSITYGAVINACTRTGDEHNAERLFETMEASRGMALQAPPYNTMLQFYTQTKPDREKALKYYQKMLALDIKPTAHTYKLLLDLHGCLEPVQAEALDNVFGRLVADRNVQVQGTHWASLINAYGCHLHDMDKAVSLFEAIPTHVSTVKSGNTKTDAVAFEALLNVFLAHHRVDLMWEYAAKLASMGMHPTAYVANLLIRGLSSASMQQQQSEQGEKRNEAIERARAIFAQMSDPPMGVAAAGNHPPNHRQHANVTVHSAPTLSSTATANGDDTQHEAQLSFFNGVLREPSTFEAMIRAEMAWGETQRAMDLVERMASRAYPPALVAKARALVLGDFSAAQS